MKPFWITTSWDDGHRLDLRLADLLDQYDLRGTFYVARDLLDERLSEAEIAGLAARHEIGAHTLTHPGLTEIDPGTARREIVDSRAWLQDVTGSAITAFCPPRGAINPAVRHLIADAGYEVARTVELYRLDVGDDRLMLPTTINVYPFPLRPSSSIRARFQPIQRALPHVPTLRLPLWALRSWPALAIALLDRVAQIGGVWHLWGHSWEIEHHGLWADLERVLAATRRYPDAHRVTNTELARAIF
ncbi:MAG: polysaccharide deacetylase family protein [Anaerolineae bacterium]|nr:polysaccharide deacetylase family protein [Anaerolineae bacterium]